MINKTLAAMALTALAAGTANAASIALIAPLSVSPGEAFSVDVFGDFGDFGFSGGAVRLTYDPTLVGITGFTFVAPADPDFSCPGGAECPPPTPGVFPLQATGFFSDLLAPGETGVIATFTMLALGDPGDLIGLMLEDFSELAGGWFGSDLIELEEAPDLFGTAVTIEGAVIPLPAAAWLLLGGLGALLGFRRR